MINKLAGAFVLNATAADVASLRATAAALEDEVMAIYEDFLYYDNRSVDELKWKPVKTDGHVRTYKEKKKRVSTSSGSPVSPTTLCELEPQASLASHSASRRVLATGMIPGNLDDALHGCSFHDTPSLRAREAYMGDHRDDCAVVLSIDGPAAKDPFRFLGVTRHVYNPLLSKTRDYLLLQHTHLTTIRSGERVGVRVRHSIAHQSFDGLLGAPNSQVLVSSVTFYRQVDEHNLEVFGTELVDKKHHTPEAIQRHGLARDLLLSSTICDLGFKKKLLWLLQQQRHDRHIAALSTVKSDRKECELCTKSTKRLLSASGAYCQLCIKHVCSSCTVTHDLMLDPLAAKTVTKSFAFCIECVLLAKQVSSLRVAQDSVRKED